MRNVAFSILLGALALLQLAVVAAELSGPGVHTARAANSDVHYALASADAAPKSSTL